MTDDTQRSASAEPGTDPAVVDAILTAENDADAPTVVVAPHAADDDSLWSRRAADAEPLAGAGASVDAAADARDRANDAKQTASEKAPDAKQRAGAKAGEARDRAAAFAANARERASSTDVKELAASTTSLIDTARPFFLAFFAVLFTVLAFVGGDSGTSQLFVVGAILCVLAAGFSDELSHIVPPQRRKARDEDDAAR